MIQIAIDGPAGAGKSQLAKDVSSALGIAYLDTGAMYRAAGLYALENGVEPSDEKRVAELLPEITIDMQPGEDGPRVFLCGQDVSEAIRENDISAAASAISAIPAVRRKLVALQRQIAGERSVIMDGRDICTVVLPEADFKYFVTARPEVRANRRRLQLLEKGVDAPLEQLLSEMRERDYADSHRADSPLAQAKDAELLDTSDMTREQAARYIIDAIISSGKEI